MYKKIFGLIHLLSFIFMSFYGIILKKNYFDKFYILLIIVILLLWLYSDNYCIFSYYFSKNIQLNDPHENEQLNDPLEIVDFNNLFDNKYNKIIKKLIFFSIFVTGISLYNVLIRNNYSKLFTFITSFLYIFYRILLRSNNKKLITITNEILKIISVIILLLVLDKEKYININNYISKIEG